MIEKIQSFLKKICEYIDKFYQIINFKKWEFLLLIMIGGFSFLFWEHLQLRKEYEETKEIANIIQKKSGLKVYSKEDLEVRQVGNLYVNIPKDWTNILLNEIETETVKKHFIASYGEEFDLPFANEYAFAIGIERRGVSTDLETFLNENAVSSDPKMSKTNYAKVNDEMFYIPRDDVGIEYFRKIDDAVVVIFVYDNGDREIDNFEQNFINNVGLAENNTLFDYK